MVPQGRYLLPMLELALLVAVVIANPFRMNRESAALRVAGLGLTALVGLSNGWSALLLAARILGGQYAAGPAALLGTGAAIWLTNVLAFALLYWELDGGGPGARVVGRPAAPDLAFAQNPGSGAGLAGVASGVRRLRLRGVHRRHQVRPHRRRGAVPQALSP
jgi:hypothetical protein